MEHDPSENIHKSTEAPKLNGDDMREALAHLQAFENDVFGIGKVPLPSENEELPENPHAVDLLASFYIRMSTPVSEGQPLQSTAITEKLLEEAPASLLQTLAAAHNQKQSMGDQQQTA